MAAPYSSDPVEPGRNDIAEALFALSDLQVSTLPVRYARMWLREAAAATNTHDEVRHLAKAEHELGRAVLASASPSPELSRAFELTMKARNEATD